MSEDNPVAIAPGAAADPRLIKKKVLDSRLRARRDADDLRQILSTLAGRRLVWRYLTICHVFETAFNNSGSVTAFNLGEQNIGLKLLAEINETDPEAYLKMLKESKEENSDATNG